MGSEFLNMKLRTWVGVGLMGAALAAVVPLRAQDEDVEKRGRKYKDPLATSKIEITVLKDLTGKPIGNAAVIFHTVLRGDDGNMELKTGPDGKATINMLPTGATVGLQVIAPGYKTHGESFVLTEPREITVRMIMPKSQVSAYETDGAGLERGTGVREPVRRKVDTSNTVLTTKDPVIKMGASKSGASLSGRILGPREIPVAGAKVTIEDPENKLKPVVVKTTNDGLFAAVGLPAGKYRVRMEAPGLTPKVHDEVVLTESQSQLLDTTMTDKKSR